MGNRTGNGTMDRIIHPHCPYNVLIASLNFTTVPGASNNTQSSFLQFQVIGTPSLAAQMSRQPSQAWQTRPQTETNSSDCRQQNFVPGLEIGFHTTTSSFAGEKSAEESHRDDRIRRVSLNRPQTIPSAGAVDTSMTKNDLIRSSTHSSTSSSLHFLNSGDLATALPPTGSTGLPSQGHSTIHVLPAKLFRSAPMRISASPGERPSSPNESIGSSYSWRSGRAGVHGRHRDKPQGPGMTESYANRGGDVPKAIDYEQRGRSRDREREREREKRPGLARRLIRRFTSSDVDAQRSKPSRPSTGDVYSGKRGKRRSTNFGF